MNPDHRDGCWDNARFFEAGKEVRRRWDACWRGVMLSRERMQRFVIRCEQRKTVVANLTVTMGKRPDCAL
jgi:hypothetical protein